jgi:hypothetical protein
MSSFPYVATSNIFNTADYNILDEGLTRATADQLYLSLGGGTIGSNLNVLGTLSINSVAVDLSLISGVVAGTSQNSKVLSLNGSGVLDKLTLNYAGIGLDTPSLKFSGTTFNQTYYLNMIEGSAEASKAIVLNSSRNISNINNITSTGIVVATNLQANNTSSTTITSSTIGSTYGLHLHSILGSSNGVYSGSSISFNNSNSDNVPLSAVYLDKIGASNGELVFATRNGATVDERLRITSSSINFTNALITGSLRFTTNANRTVMRDSTITSSFGIEYYDDTFTSLPMINFKTGNNNNPHFARFCGYLNDNDGTGAYPANGVPFDFDQFMNSSFDSGFRLSAINVNQANNNNANIGLWSRNFTIPHVIAHDRFNQTLIKPTSTQLTSQISGFDIVLGASAVMHGLNEMRGNATVFSLRNTTGTTSDRLSYIMTHNTEWEFSLGGSAHSTVPNGLYWYNGGNFRMVLRDTGRLGVGGVTNPRCGLEVSGSVSQTTVPFGTNTFSYNVSNDVYTNHGGGPFSYSVCAWFNGNIYVNNSIYNASDRRLKENIKALDIDIEHYKKINPVSYTYKNDNKSQLGFIAQEMRSICGEAVSYADNENLKKETEDDIEGVQMNIDYKQISVMNCAIIKKLIDRIEQLEKKDN